jgi:hypothetical protein
MNFQPIKSLKNKNNFKEYYRVEKNGDIKKRIFLDIPNIALREEIICKHYLSFLVRNFVQKRLMIHIVDRDNPWDFNIKLSNGLQFNIEITSIADNQWRFEKTKREEKCSKLFVEEKITLRELKKIHSWFGGDESAQIIQNAEDKSIGPNELVNNPFYNKKGIIYLSSSGEEKKSLSKLILEAIERKNKKNHNGKENTILIIDNRSIRFKIEDYQKAMKELKNKISNSIFPEIYFYTGYYSDNDGNHAEYSFAPIKLPDEKIEQLKNRISLGELVLDDAGVAHD